MFKKLGLGCLALLVLGVGVIVVVALASSGGGRGTSQTTTASGAARPSANPRAEAAPIGDTAQRGNWEVTIDRFAPWAEFSTRPPSTPPQGRLMVVEFRAKNLHQTTSQFGPQDFTIEAGDGRKFQPASTSIDKGVVITQRVQPGLTTENRLVFDLDPAQTDLVLIGLGMYFRLAE